MIWKPSVLIAAGLGCLVLIKILLLAKAYHNAHRDRPKASPRHAKKNKDIETEDQVQGLTLRLQAVESERQMFSEKIQAEQAELVRAKEVLEKREAALRRFIEKVTRGFAIRVEDVVRGRDPVVLKNVVTDFQKASDVSSKNLRLNPHVFFLKPLLSELEEETYSLRATKEVGLTIDLAEGFSLFADPDAVKRVLFLLISGLFPLCHAGDHYKIIVGEGEAWTRLAVFKSGTGIPEDDLPDIFEAFPKFSESSLGDDFGGSGLDFLLARRLVEAHKGQITAENLPNGGCRLLVTLPKNN